jgi:ubiquinone biosynthesis UbiH/UbiF/VisC/COQ6 family hydroxylase
VNSAGYDVAVVGAGMVGSAAACALAANGFDVALIEALPPSVDDSPEYDLRVSAISPRSRGLLERLGAWQRLAPERVCGYEKMYIWHQPGSASVAFDAADLARADLGAIVENRQLQRALHRACEQQQTIRWYMPDRIEALLENGDHGVEVRLASGQRLRAGLLIAADGRNSPTRRLAGIESPGGKYRQTAIVANVDTALAHRHTAWQRFLSSGPLAFLPLANGQSSIVWSCDDPLADVLLELEDKDFCEALGQAFEHRLGEVTACSKRLAFPLGWHRCERWFAGRLLLAGDAAHGVHPLAGQGVNLGFSDVDWLARELVDREQLSRRRNLRRYERQRKSETWLATLGFGGLKRVYGSESAALGMVRDLGMRMVDKTPRLKRELMQKAVDNLT